MQRDETRSSPKYEATPACLPRIQITLVFQQLAMSRGRFEQLVTAPAPVKVPDRIQFMRQVKTTYLVMIAGQYAGIALFQ